MRIMHVALGGCLSAAPVRYGLTEDTGGHIAYVLGATQRQAERPEVEEVTIVTRAFDAPELGREFALAEEDLGPRRRILRLRTGNSAYLEKADLLAELPALKAAFLDMLAHGPRPDVIHAHFSDGAALARAARARFGIPYVFSSHSLGMQKSATADPAARARIARETAAIRDADAIIASSRDEAERQLRAYDLHASGKTHRVGPGVTLAPADGTARARALVTSWLRDPGKPVILAIARPVEKKNLVALVEAYAASPDLQARANLVIVAGLRDRIGGGATETERVVSALFDRVDRHDLWGRVALPRRHDARDVRSLYALAAEGGVFVNPALHEPFGLTVVEAVQAGVPVVATRDGAPSEILAAAGHGRAFDPRDRGAMTEAILALLDDPDRDRRTAEAARRARAAYSWRGWAREVAAVYASVIDRGAGTGARPTRLLVSDMDGTLTGDRDAASRLGDWLARSPEWEFAIATGRAISEARRVLSHWGLPEPRCLISSVGSEIWHRCAGGRFMLDSGFALRIARGWNAPAILDALRADGLTLQAEYEQRPWKVSLIGDADTAERVRACLRAEGLDAQVVFSHGRLIDVLPLRAGKAAAAEHLARRRGLTAADCLVAGDSGNDRDLLEWGGFAVLPANARPELADLRRPGLLRARGRSAAGVLEALELIAPPAARLIAAE